MGIPYDIFTNAFLSKITEFDFLAMNDFNRNSLVDGYMKRTLAQLSHVCPYSFLATCDDMIRQFDLDIPKEELDELVEIVSEGMLVQWMKPYVFKAENLENVLNTKDFVSYSPAELLLRITNAYNMAKSDFTKKVNDYSYDHGDLSDLSL